MSLKKEINKAKYKIKSLLSFQKSKTIKKNYLLNNYKENTNRLIIMFVPNGAYRINGGILSICTIYDQINKLKTLHNCDVIASYLPDVSSFDYTYKTFKNDIVIFNFKEIIGRFHSLDYLEVHIPEIMVSKFKEKASKFQTFYNFLKSAKSSHLNILNQNDLLLPSIEYLDFIKSKFTTYSMTVAHKKYATQEKSNSYNMPLHLLSPWLNPVPYKVRSYNEKSNIIIYSPDPIQWIPNKTELHKQNIIDNLKKELPNFEFIEIKNLKYEEYKELASKAKFSITFGEGLDGYFTEAVFSGGVSFAVYNAYFFSDEFKNLYTLFDSFAQLNQDIVEKIKFLDHPDNYLKCHNEIANIVNKMYGLEKLEQDLSEYFKKDYDFK